MNLSECVCEGNFLTDETEIGRHTLNVSESMGYSPGLNKAEPRHLCLVTEAAM